MVFFIGGTKPRETVLKKGTFYCPVEGSEQRFEHKALKQTATAFFVPVVDYKDLGEYVECKSCGSTFAPEVLEIDNRVTQPSLYDAMSMLLSAMIIADGEVKQEELKWASDLLIDLDPPYDMERFLREARQDKRELDIVLQEASANLSVEHREALLEMAMVVAGSDGGISQEELDLIERAGKNMGFDEEGVAHALAEFVRKNQG